MAAARAGLADEAGQLLAWTRHLRDSDGAYWTGCAHPDCVRFPGGQRSSYSAAAVVIADHVLHGRSAAAATFREAPDSQGACSEMASLTGPRTANAGPEKTCAEVPAWQ
jgi:hypothetical protein